MLLRKTLLDNLLGHAQLMQFNSDMLPKLVSKPNIKSKNSARSLHLSNDAVRYLLLLGGASVVVLILLAIPGPAKKENGPGSEPKQPKPDKHKKSGLETYLDQTDAKKIK